RITDAFTGSLPPLRADSGLGDPVNASGDRSILRRSARSQVGRQCRTRLLPKPHPPHRPVRRRDRVNQEFLRFPELDGRVSIKDRVMLVSMSSVTDLAKMAGHITLQSRG